MIALPAGPAVAPRRQLFVATALACAAGATLLGGMLALWMRFRTAVLDDGGEWLPSDVTIPEVASNVMLLSFLGIGIFAQWAVYAARRGDRAHTGVALGLVGLLGLAVINGQAYVYSQMQLAIADSAYTTLFYAITGTFLALMIAGLVFTGVTAFRFLGGRTRDREIVAAHAMFWYFLAAAFSAVWFVIYVTK